MLTKELIASLKEVNYGQVNDTIDRNLQPIADEAYAKWDIDANDSYTDMKNKLTLKQRKAVVLGKFYQQVTNGGIQQYWGNGYMKDDMDELIQYVSEMKTSTAPRLLEMLTELSDKLEGDYDEQSFYREKKDYCECPEAEEEDEYGDPVEYECTCGYESDQEEVKDVEYTMDRLTDEFYTFSDLFILEVCAVVNATKN